MHHSLKRPHWLKGTYVKVTFGHLRTALLLICAINLMTLAASAAEPARVDLTATVKWAVWHEGCRIYAGDDSFGNVDQIRECVQAVYANNAYARQMVHDASKTVLAHAVRAAASEVPTERQYEKFVEYACKNQGLMAQFKQLADAGDHDAVRALFYENFKSFPEIRNLLAAVSNKQLSTLIRELEFGERVSQMRAQMGNFSHVPMAQAD
jgi:hypothetical protein